VYRRHPGGLVLVVRLSWMAEQGRLEAGDTKRMYRRHPGGLVLVAHLRRMAEQGRLEAGDTKRMYRRHLGGPALERRSILPSNRESQNSNFENRGMGLE